MDRDKLRAILLTKPDDDLLGIWLTAFCDDERERLVDQILDAGDFNLALALNINLGWRCRLTAQTAY